MVVTKSHDTPERFSYFSADGPPPPHHPHPHSPSRDSVEDREQQHELQKDQPQRGVVLGPPGHPQGGRLASPATQEEERLSGLEQRLAQMAVMLDMVKAQVSAVALGCYTPCILLLCINKG